jgi:hypothetical protein
MSALVHLVDLDSRATRPRNRRTGPVRRLRLGDALLELVARFLRRGTPRLHRAVHLLALHVERMSSGIDLIFNAAARVSKVSTTVRLRRSRRLGRASNAPRAA